MASFHSPMLGYEGTLLLAGGEMTTVKLLGYNMGISSVGDKRNETLVFDNGAWHGEKFFRSPFSSFLFVDLSPPCLHTKTRLKATVIDPLSRCQIFEIFDVAGVSNPNRW